MFLKYRRYKHCRFVTLVGVARPKSVEGRRRVRRRGWGLREGEVKDGLTRAILQKSKVCVLVRLPVTGSGTRSTGYSGIRDTDHQG